MTPERANPSLLNNSNRMRFLVRASYLQIYNEQISDLLKPERNNLTIREDKKRGVFVEGLSEWVVRGGTLDTSHATCVGNVPSIFSNDLCIRFALFDLSEAGYEKRQGILSGQVVFQDVFECSTDDMSLAVWLAAAAKVRTPGEIYGLMERGGQLRATGATRMNDTSSRSHAVFIIIVEQVIWGHERRTHMSQGFIYLALGENDDQGRAIELLVEQISPFSRQNCSVRPKSAKLTVFRKRTWMCAPR